MFKTIARNLDIYTLLGLLSQLSNFHLVRNVMHMIINWDFDKKNLENEKIPASTTKDFDKWQKYI